MIDTKLRKKFQPIFNKLGNVLIRLKFSPNVITIIALILGIMAALFLACDYRSIAFILLWLSGLFDVLDGTVARLLKISSNSGAYMDLIFDRMVEAFIILGFYHLFPEYAFTYLVFFTAVLFNFTTFIAAGALFKNTSSKSMFYDVGIAERTETFLVFTAMIIFTNHIEVILMSFNIIVFLTGIIRFYRITEFEKNLNK